MWEQIVAGITHFRLDWRDVIDIIVVAYFLYRLILLIRGTRAQQLIKGLIILLIALVASEELGLQTINWVLRGLMTMGLVAIPIIFQPELRRALEQLGRGSIFKRSFYSLEEENFRKVMDELLKAIPVLVKKKIGAIIVLEKETGLKDFIETGIKIEGTVTAELLINIFMPRSPLHDGAVIIRGNVVAAAGCYLPLTENPHLSKELGTRHRASLGLTEVSDAVVIIVSEETGVISLAHNGKLIRYLDEKTLRSNLIDLYLTPSPKKSYQQWSRRFFKNDAEEE